MGAEELRSLMNAFNRLWRGQYSLPKTFFGFYVFGINLWIVFVAVGLKILELLHLDAAFDIFSFVSFGSYFLIATVGVWRSAALPIQRGSIFWPMLARALVCFMAVLWYSGVVLWGVAELWMGHS